MNYLGIQNMILKAKEDERKKGKPFDFRYEIVDDKILITDTHTAWMIPLEAFYLDVEKVFDKEPLKIFKKVFNGLTDAQVVMETGDCKRLDKCIVTRLSCDGFDVWIDEKKLKYFDKNGLAFMAAAENSVVYVLEDETPVGLVLPVKLR